MATYRPSFVDVSGFTAGLSRGLEMEAQRKRQEDALAEQRVDEFLKTYRPDKLRDNDIGQFTSAFGDFKQAALAYSRMNRSGAKAEDLSKAKLMMDRSLGNLNSIYTNSAIAANKMAEYGDYIKRARIQGLNIPKEVTDNYNILLSNNITAIDAPKIPSAYDYELIPKEVDQKQLGYMLAAVGANATTNVEERDYKIGTLGGKDITGKERITIQSRPMDKTINGVRLAAMNDNALRQNIKTLYELFKMNKSSYMNELTKINPSITEDQVDGATIYAMQHFMPTVIDRKRDNTGANLQINAIKLMQDKNYKDALLRLRQKGLDIQQQKINEDKRNQIDPAKDIAQFEQDVKLGRIKKNADGTYSVPDVQGFSGVSKYKFGNAMVEYITYNPSNGKYTLKTTDFNSKPQTVSSKELKNILIQGTKGATNKPYSLEEMTPTIDELESAGYTPDAEMRKLLEGINFGGEQRDNNEQ